MRDLILFSTCREELTLCLRSCSSINEFVDCLNGTNLEEIKCKEKACTIQTCPNYPEAQCM